MLSTEIFILIGALLGGYVSGLTGFGTGLTALPIWLIAVQPLIAGPIVVICSLTAQLFTLHSIWASIAWKRVVPYLVSAMAGVPIGTLLLGYVDAETFRISIGALLILYSGIMLLCRSKLFTVNGNRFSDALIGFGGGVMGGIAGLCGVLPTIWIGLHNWKKSTKRGFFQGFNIAVLSMSALSMWLAGYLTIAVGKMALIALPGTFIGAWLGRRTYSRMDDLRFDKAVLIVLLFSGFLIILVRLFLSP